VRWATLVLLTLVSFGSFGTLVACNDLREFRGAWRGPRVGDAPVLHIGLGDGTAVLSIDRIDGHGLAARLAIDGLLPEAPISSLPGAEADALAGITFGGNPLRVYLAFVAMPDAGGDALVVVALYDDRRIEVRLLRGGTKPLYGIFALTESAI
jgi:hypothetical protein